MASPFQGVDAPTVQIFPREGREGREGGGKEREWREGRGGKGGEGRDGREGRDGLKTAKHIATTYSSYLWCGLGIALFYNVTELSNMEIKKIYCAQFTGLTT